MIGGAKGIGLGLDFGIGNQLRPRNSKPYIEQAVLDSLCGVWIADQNTNESPTRNIIKNKLKDRGGDFEILNAAYKLNSGYGLYQFDWSTWSIDTNEVYGIKVTKEHNKVTYQGVLGKGVNLYNRSSRGVTRFKIKLSDANCGIEVLYKTGTPDNTYIIAYHKSGILEHDIEVPDSELINITMSSFNTDSITIEQVPEYKGAFITDGADDLIASQKTTPEMLSNGNEITVVTMSVNLLQVGGKRINFLSSISSYLENILATTAIDKHSISGYTSTNYDTAENHLSIPFILGDIEDYTLNKANDSSTRGFNRFGVNGYVTVNTYRSANIAWYWTFIANKVLTEDQINQVIEYFNLDKYVKPDIIYNVKKQGITNDNHAEFGDKLIDYSGNGHDMQLYNIGWETSSGIDKYEGALVLDGVNDYGKVTNLPIYKDYTVVVDREILQTGKSGCVISKNNPGAFLMELGSASASQSIMAGYSFGMNTILTVNSKRQFSYQSKYLYNGETVSAGTDNDTKEMWLGTIRDLDYRLSNIVFYSAMLFPYSLSKFLIERQLKRHKLGTMYEDMIQFRPEVSSNVPYNKIEYFDENWNLISVGDYIPINSAININITLIGGGDEVSNVNPNQGVVLKVGQSGTTKPNIWDIRIGSITKSILKLDIAIDEYIRFEDIVQPYPFFMEFAKASNEPGWENKLTWGSKLRVGKKYLAAVWNDLFGANSGYPLYVPTDKFKIFYNEVRLMNGLSSFIIAEKSMVFRQEGVEWMHDSNEPKCILSPELLKIPNESYKYLGYIPDISGHGNHGFFNNVGFTDVSGADINGIIHLDGVDDFIRINNLSIGGRQMFMKFSYDGNGSLAYDQRDGGTDNFAMFVGKDDNLAHNFRNSGNTYINGILNKHILSTDLNNIIHNATLVNDIDIDVVSRSPVIGCNAISTDYYTKMSLYTFMLFDEISTPEKIRELNEIIGINPMIDVPPYYYDAYGKSNEDANKAELTNLGNGGEHTLTLNNFGFNGESGYCDVTFIDWDVATVNRYISDNEVIINDVESIYEHSIDQYNTFIWGKWLTQHNNPMPSNDTPSFYAKFSGIPQGGSIAYIYVKEDGTIDKKIMNENDIYYLLPDSYNTRYKEPVGLQTAKMGFLAVKPWESSAPLTIKIANGLVLDGVNDTLVNTTIPALTDFTCIVKREDIGERISSSAFMYKGGSDNLLTEEKAFLYNYKNDNGEYIYCFDKYNNLDPVAPISYITPTSADNRSITRGTGKDTNGLTIGRWNTYWKGVFYKLMLYPKTLDLLQIRMLKNLFELDEKIDVNNPIFKK